MLPITPSKYAGLKVMLCGVFLMFLSVVVVNLFYESLSPFFVWMGWAFVMIGWVVHIAIMILDRMSRGK